MQLGAMAMPPSFKYMDVFLRGKPQHEGWDAFTIKHPPMPTYRWAKIFSPFDALKGFDEVIGSKEVRYVDKAELDEDSKQELSHKLSILQGYTYNGRMAKMNRIMVTVEYFVPCTDQDNFAFVLEQGRYEKISGMVLNVDEIRETLSLMGETGKVVIDFEDILDIEPEKSSLFEDVPDEVW